MHYRTFIYTWETWLSIYSNYGTIEKDILNKFPIVADQQIFKKKII